MTVLIAPSLIHTCYGEFAGKHLQFSLSKAFEPSREAIEQHYKVFLQNSKEGN